MNTLNNIHALVDIDTEKAKQTIVELSRLMRYVLYESNNRLISLSKELQFLNHYIELMRIRYTDKVRIDVSFPTDTGEVQVPPLLFVSFVENAFKHGVSYQHASFVSVCLQVVGEEIHFVCSNSNYYRSEDQHHGIGLDNIRKRLRLLFGERYKLSIDDTADCFDVQLLVPVSYTEWRYIMINCIAIDDEPLALTQLTGYISRVPFLNLVASCQDAFDAMSVLSAQKIDLMFVDINMPDLNGMDFVRSLTEKPLVIFTTAYSEYAVEGFKVDALDYLLKPFGFQDFLKAVDKAYKWWEFRTKGHGTVAPPSTPSELSFNDGTLFVKSDYRVTRINLADIKYIEGMSEYVRIFLACASFLERPIFR